MNTDHVFIVRHYQAYALVNKNKAAYGILTHRHPDGKWYGYVKWQCQTGGYDTPAEALKAMVKLHHLKDIDAPGRRTWALDIKDLANG